MRERRVDIKQWVRWSAIEREAAARGSSAPSSIIYLDTSYLIPALPLACMNTGPELREDSHLPSRAPRNRTISCTDQERRRLTRDVICLDNAATWHDLAGRVVAGDIFEVAKHFPSAFVDLLILDPPYNISKNFNGSTFTRQPAHEYRRWFQDLIELLAPMLKPSASLYVCADWSTSTLIFPVLEASFHVRNRITWEREKGRGAKKNWKNNTEDIWFCTKSDCYYFDVDAVKLKRRVLAPYRADGKPKDWAEEQDGKFRLTHPSNIWTDITVPFWSMPENTDHPTQKPEKLMAKLILASSRPGDCVFDPFLGSGTTAVVAEKLSRRWCGVEIDGEYQCLALKRLAAAKTDSAIQGYSDGVFWDRKALSGRPRRTATDNGQSELFS